MRGALYCKRNEAKKPLPDDIDPLALKRETRAAREASEKDERENFAFTAREWFETYNIGLHPDFAQVDYEMTSSVTYRAFRVSLPL